MNNIGEVDGYCFELYVSVAGVVSTYTLPVTERWIYLGAMDRDSITQAIATIGEELSIRQNDFLKGFLWNPEVSIKVSGDMFSCCEFTPRHKLRGMPIKIRQPGVVSLLH